MPIISRLGRFILRTKAASAKVKLLKLAFDHDGSRVNIGRPAPFGVALRVTDVITEKRCLAADIALQFQSPSKTKPDICNLH